MAAAQPEPPTQFHVQITNSLGDMESYFPTIEEAQLFIRTRKANSLRVILSIVLTQILPNGDEKVLYSYQ